MGGLRHDGCRMCGAQMQRRQSRRIEPEATHAPSDPPPYARRHPATQRGAGPAQDRDRLRRHALELPRVSYRLRARRRRPRGAGRRQGRPRRDPGAQLARVRSAALCHRAHRRGAGADQLHAEGRRGGVHPAPRRRAHAGHRQRAGGAGARRRRARHEGRALRVAAGRGAERAGARHAALRRAGREHRAGAGRRSGRRRPGADRLHQRHRVAAEGRDADARRGAVAVRELHRRRRHRARRPGAARAAAVPLRAARRVSRPFAVCRRHQRHHRQAGAREPAAVDGAARRHVVLRAADGVDLAAALAAVRCDRPLVAEQGLLRRIDHAGGGAARDCRAAAERAAVEPVRPDRDCAAGDDARPRRATARSPARAAARR